MVPDNHPYFTSLIVSDDGYLWVSRVAPGGNEGYDVFDEEMRFLGTLPAPFAQYPEPHITALYIVGVTLDSLDVPFVEVHRIVRSST